MCLIQEMLFSFRYCGRCGSKLYRIKARGVLVKDGCKYTGELANTKLDGFGILEYTD